VLVTDVLCHGVVELSLWVEALSIHECSLFTETVQQPGGGLIIRRGNICTLLTDRFDNRRPLDWEARRRSAADRHPPCRGRCLLAVTPGLAFATLATSNDAHLHGLLRDEATRGFHTDKRHAVDAHPL
jgi:hypothetical protein